MLPKKIATYASLRYHVSILERSKVIAWHRLIYYTIPHDKWATRRMLSMLRQLPQREKGI